MILAATINRPTLWSVDTPYLYEAVSRITEGGVLKDVYETSFGVREITNAVESVARSKPPVMGPLFGGAAVVAK